MVWNHNCFCTTSCEELTHWKRPWCWEGLGAGGEGDDREWNDWMASLTQWTWVWVNSGSWWWTGRPGVLQFMGFQRVRHSWATELNWTELKTLCHNLTASQARDPNQCPLSQWCHPTISSSVVPFSSCLNLSQHQDLFKWVSSLHQVAKVLEFQLQLQSFQWIFRTDFLQAELVGSLCSPRDSQESSPTPQFKSINFSTQLSSQSNSHIHTWPLEKP